MSAAPADHAALEAALLDAHRAGDAGRLATLYAAAAAVAETPEAAAFFRTHAYVYGLDAGDPVADAMHAALLAEGREDP
ncbi:MAG: hypothetical protein AAF698_03495 [Pseudomonadota bacterium]